MLVKLSMQPFLATQVRLIKEPIQGSFKMKIILQVKKKKHKWLYTSKNMVAQHLGGKTVASKGLLIICPWEGSEA